MPRALFNYQTGAGEISQVSLDTAIGALGGSNPGAATVNWKVQAGGSSRKRVGVRARSVVYSRNVGTADAPSVKRIRIVFFTESAYAAAPATVTYKTATWTRTSFRPEDV